MARIAWVEDAEAEGELAEYYSRMHEQGGHVPDMLRTMSLRPDFLFAMNDASRLHFSD